MIACRASAEPKCITAAPIDGIGPSASFTRPYRHSRHGVLPGTTTVSCPCIPEIPACTRIFLLLTHHLLSSLRDEMLSRQSSTTSHPSNTMPALLLSISPTYADTLM